MECIRLLVNLLNNALDAVESQKGLIRVTCKFDESKQRPF